MFLDNPQCGDSDVVVPRNAEIWIWHRQAFRHGHKQKRVSTVDLLNAFDFEEKRRQ